MFLPPLLFAAALGSSFVALRDVRAPVGLLALGLVLFTAAAVAFAVSPLVSGLSLAAAFAIGAIVAPPDAVAATAVARRAGMRRRTVTILEGESLFNDATALTALRVAVAAAASGSVTVVDIGVDFLQAVAGGLAVGITAAYVLGWLRRRGIDTLSGTALSVAAPFAAYVAAEEIGGSGIIAVVVTGLILGHRAPADLRPDARITETEIWRTIQFVLEGAVFALIGLQLPAIIDNVTEPPGTVVAVSAVTLAVVVLARPIWIVGSVLFSRVVPWLDLGRPRWSDLAVVSWAGMRGVVSLAAAQSLPLDFPHRDLALLVTVVVIFGTLVLQGPTLPTVMRLVGARRQDSRMDALAIARAQEDAVEAALRRLDQLVAEEELPDAIVEKLRLDAERRKLIAWVRLGRADGSEPPSQRRGHSGPSRAVCGRLDPRTLSAPGRRPDHGASGRRRVCGVHGRGATRLGPPEDLPRLRLHRMLRLLAAPPCAPALRGRGPPGDPLGRAGRKLAMVLRRARTRLTDLRSHGEADPDRSSVSRLGQAWKPRRRADRVRCRLARSRRNRLTSIGSWTNASGRSMSALSTW